MSPTDRDLLLGAMHALRSYQAGNAAPDLARAVADDIERRLGRTPGRPSLTPNEDTARAMMAGAPHLRKIGEPGRIGTMARIGLAMAEARAVAFAREIDRAAPPGDLLDGFVKATGDEIATVCICMSTSPTEMGGALVNAVSLQAALSLAAIGKGEAEGVFAPLASVASA